MGTAIRVKPSSGKVELALALAVFTAIAFLGITTKSLWVDEAFSLDAARQSLPGAIRQAVSFEGQSPVYYVVLHHWLKLAPSLMAARCLSLILVGGGITLLWLTAQDLHLPPALASVPLLAAVSPQFVYAAMEVRSYGLMLLLVSASWYFLVRAWLSDHPARTADVIGFALSAYLALITFYYSGFVLAGQLVAAWYVGRRRKELVIAAGAICIAFAPWVPLILSQFLRRPTSDTEATGAVNTTSAVMPDLLQALTQSLISAPIALRHIVVLGWLALLAALTLARWRLGRGTTTRSDRALLLANLVAALFPVTLLTTGLALVYPRHWAPLVPGLILLLATTVAGVRPSALRRTLAAAILLAFGAGVVSLFRNLSPSDWRGIATHVEKLRSSSEPVLFFPSRGVLMYREYAGADRLFGLPTDVELVRYPLDSAMTIRTDAEIGTRIRAVVPPGASFWLVEENVFRGFGDSLLGEYRAQWCQAIDSVTVSGLNARRLQCRTGR